MSVSAFFKQRLVIGGLIILLLVASSLTLFFMQKKSPDVRVLIQQGDQQFAAKHYSEALRFYLQAAEQKPSSPEIKAKIKQVDIAIQNLQATAGAANTQSPAATAVNSDSKEQSVPTSDGTIPNLIGMTRENAEKLLLDKGIHYQYSIQPDSAPKNTVYMQDMKPGHSYKASDRITFYVSSGH